MCYHHRYAFDDSHIIPLIGRLNFSCIGRFGLLWYLKISDPQIYLRNKNMSCVSIEF